MCYCVKNLHLRKKKGPDNNKKINKISKKSYKCIWVILCNYAGGGHPRNQAGMSQKCQSRVTHPDLRGRAVIKSGNAPTRKLYCFSKFKWPFMSVVLIYPKTWRKYGTLLGHWKSCFPFNILIFTQIIDTVWTLTTILWLSMTNHPHLGPGRPCGWKTLFRNFIFRNILFFFVKEFFVRNNKINMSKWLLVRHSKPNFVLLCFVDINHFSPRWENYFPIFCFLKE